MTFDLSSKRIPINDNSPPKEGRFHIIDFHYPESEVKEFIKLSKEDNPQALYDDLVRDQGLDQDEIVEIICKYFNDKSKKLAGKDLI